MDFFLFILKGMTAITVALYGAHYIAGVLVLRDPLFFMREKLFKRKLIKNGYHNASDFLASLADTNEKDWELDGTWIYYKPYSDIKIVFSFHRNLHLRIYEEKSKSNVLDLVYETEISRLRLHYDYTAKNGWSKEEEFRTQQILYHLKEVYNTVLSIQKNTEKEQREKEESDSLKQKEMKKAQLVAMLEKGAFFGLEQQENGFSVRFKSDDRTKYLEVSLDGVVYFQSIQMGVHSMKTTILNQQSNEATIFTECAAELYDYARTLFYAADRSGQTGHSTKETETKEKTSYHDTDFERSFKEHLMPIRQLLKELACEEKWLSVESYHQITETFPNDLHALGEAVSVVTHQEKAKEYADEALHIIYKKLLDFTREAEQNKLKAVERQKRIIEKR